MTFGIFCLYLSGLIRHDRTLVNLEIFGMKILDMDVVNTFLTYRMSSHLEGHHLRFFFLIGFFIFLYILLIMNTLGINGKILQQHICFLISIVFICKILDRNMEKLILLHAKSNHIICVEVKLLTSRRHSIPALRVNRGKTS